MEYGRDIIFFAKSDVILSASIFGGNPLFLSPHFKYEPNRPDLTKISSPSNVPIDSSSLAF